MLKAPVAFVVAVKWTAPLASTASTSAPGSPTVISPLGVDTVPVTVAVVAQPGSSSAFSKSCLPAVVIVVGEPKKPQSVAQLPSAISG